MMKDPIKQIINDLYRVTSELVTTLQLEEDKNYYTFPVPNYYIRELEKHNELLRSNGRKLASIIDRLQELKGKDV